MNCSGYWSDICAIDKQSTLRNSWDLHLQRDHLPIFCHSGPKLCAECRKTVGKKI